MTDCHVLLRVPEPVFAGSGFVLAGGVTVTAAHVIGGRDPAEIVVRTAEGATFTPESVSADPLRDVAMLRATAAPRSSWRAGQAVAGARWIVGSRPRDDDPQLSGTVAAADRRVVTAAGPEVSMVQLTVDQPLDDFGGYSGGAVRLAAAPAVVIGVLSEQFRSRLAGAGNVLYAVPIAAMLPAGGLPGEVAARVRALLSAGRAGEADQELNRLPHTDRRTADYWFLKSRVALAGGNPAGALAYVEQALLVSPGHAPAVATRVTILLLQNTPSTRLLARRVARDGRRLDPALDAWLDCLDTCGMFGDGVRTATDLATRCPLPADLS